MCDSNPSRIVVRTGSVPVHGQAAHVIKTAYGHLLLVEFLWQRIGPQEEGRLMITNHVTSQEAPLQMGSGFWLPNGWRCAHG